MASCYHGYWCYNILQNCAAAHPVQWPHCNSWCIPLSVGVSRCRARAKLATYMTEFTRWVAKIGIATLVWYSQALVFAQVGCKSVWIQSLCCWSRAKLSIVCLYHGGVPSYLCHRLGICVYDERQRVEYTRVFRYARGLGARMPKTGSLHTHTILLVSKPMWINVMSCNPFWSKCIMPSRKTWAFWENPVFLPLPPPGSAFGPI